MGRLPVSRNSKERPTHGCTRASAAPVTSDGIAIRAAAFGKAGRSLGIKHDNVFIASLLRLRGCQTRLKKVNLKK
jgi:hypothetical protein